MIFLCVNFAVLSNVWSKKFYIHLNFFVQVRKTMFLDKFTQLLLDLIFKFESFKFVISLPTK